MSEAQAPTTEAPSGQQPHDVPAQSEVVQPSRLPTLAEQVRAEYEKQKAEHRAKKASGQASRGDDGRFKKEAEEEAAAAREDGDRGGSRGRSKAREFDDDKAAEAEEKSLEAERRGESTEADEDPKAEPGDAAEAKPKGQPQAARWRVKLKRGEERLQAFQSQLSEQARQVAEMKRDIEARAKEVDAKAERIARAEALEQMLADDPLSLIYQRKLDPEQLVLRHYERVKAGTAGQAPQAAERPSQKSALEAKLEALEAKLAEAEKAKETEAQSAKLTAARQQFLGQVSEETYPDLDAYRDVRGDDDVLLSAFGDGGASYELSARLGRDPTTPEILKELNRRAASWLSERKLAKRFAARPNAAASDRVPEQQSAAKPEGATPTSKTLSNRQVHRVTPPKSPNFGDRSDTTSFLVDALRAGRRG